VIFVVTRFVTAFISAFFAGVEASRIHLPWTHVDTAAASRRILVGLAWLFAVVVAYPYIPGSGSNVFKGVSVFAGVMLSLGSTGLVNHAMGGLVLMYSRAFRRGEYVRIGDTEGIVLDLGMLSTKVRTYRGEVISLPNAVAVAARTVNYSRTESPMLSTSVSIGYDAPWRQVHALLLLAAERTAGLKRDPGPFVLQRALDDFFVEYELNAYLEDTERRPYVLSQMLANIQDCFNEHGVQILSPHYESQPSTRVVVPKEQWHRMPAPPPDQTAPG
jgi:small-conductance mechanosensitive channel